MRHSSTAVRLTIVPLLAASFLAGCGDDEETAYCVDENDEVVENDYCDDDSRNGAYFWYFGSAGSGIKRGSKVSGGERVRASDRAALAQRGGFGSSASKGGAGRSFSSPSGGGGSRSGGG
jgi:hypothetical protein